VTEFIIEYYDSGSSSWVEISDWVDLEYKFPNGELQFAPTAKFTTDKDESLNAHQKVRIFEV